MEITRELLLCYSPPFIQFDNEHKAVNRSFIKFNSEHKIVNSLVSALYYGKTLE